MRARLIWSVVVPSPRVIVHTGSGWRDALPRQTSARRATSTLTASIERPGMRSAHVWGPRVMERTSAVNALDNFSRTSSRESLRRSRESRGAVRAGKDNVDNTVVVLKERPAFRNTSNDLQPVIGEAPKDLLEEPGSFA